MLSKAFLISNDEGVRDDASVLSQEIAQALCRAPRGLEFVVVLAVGSSVNAGRG